LIGDGLRPAAGGNSENSVDPLVPVDLAHLLDGEPSTLEQFSGLQRECGAG
jgi:hypothetical protein